MIINILYINIYINIGGWKHEKNNWKIWNWKILFSLSILKGLVSMFYSFNAITEKGQNIKKHSCKAAKHRFFPTFFPLFYSCNGQKPCKSPLFHYFLLHMQHIYMELILYLLTPFACFLTPFSCFLTSFPTNSILFIYSFCLLFVSIQASSWQATLA